MNGDDASRFPTRLKAGYRACRGDRLLRDPASGRFERLVDDARDGLP